MVVELDQPGARRPVRLLGVPVKLSRTPGDVAGLRIAELKREGAISDMRPPRGRASLVERRALSAVRLGGDPMTISAVLDAAGRRRSPATMPG